MRFFLLLLSLLFVWPQTGAARYAPDSSISSPCGEERWAIKTLADPDAPKINFTPKESTVAQLTQLPVPTDFSPDNDSIRYTSEKQVWSVKARLVGWKIEKDHDFHIVIADPDTGATMIIEPPDPTCPGIQRKYGQKFAAVRKNFVKCFGPPTPRFRHFPPMTVQVQGVGFFDVLHGQTGVAPNGFELHPLLEVKTLQGTCPLQNSPVSGSIGQS